MCCGGRGRHSTCKKVRRSWWRKNMYMAFVSFRCAPTAAAHNERKIENTLECYHCAPMHPELCALIPLYRTGKLFIDDDNSAGMALADHVEAFTLTGKASRPPLPGLLLEDTRRYYGLLLMPNVFINLLSDHVAIDTFQPLAPDLTRVTTGWLFDPEAMSRTDFDPSDAVELLDLVNRQDWEVCDLAQQGVTSRAYRHGGNYAPDEHHLRGFVDYVLEKLGQSNTFYSL